MQTQTIQQQINLLQRRLERERSARKEAERLLETKSLDLYRVNQALLASRDELERRVLERTAELARSNQHLASAKELAEAANAAKSQFLAKMSHEMRTPLHVILSFANLGRKKLHRIDTHKIDDYLSRIQGSGNILLALVEDLLDIAKLQSGTVRFSFEQADLVGTVAAVVDEIASLIQARGLRVELDGGREPIRATFDRTRISRVLRNVLHNAIKFSPEGGVITVGLRQADGHARISIRDHGPGVPQAELESIFERFAQASNNPHHSGGTGLGLAICREIMINHGGRIWARNHPEGGAVFRIDWPLAGPPDAA